jgi:hypothetical protein
LTEYVAIKIDKCAQPNSSVYFDQVAFARLKQLRDQDENRDRNLFIGEIKYRTLAPSHAQSDVQDLIVDSVKGLVPYPEDDFVATLYGPAASGKD